MVTIGRLKRENDGSFKGELKSFSFQEPLQVIVNDDGVSPAGACYIVWSNEREIGSGRIMIDEAGQEVLQIEIFDPRFGGEAIVARLDKNQADNEEAQLLWEPKG